MKRKRELTNQRGLPVNNPIVELKWRRHRVCPVQPRFVAQLVVQADPELMSGKIRIELLPTLQKGHAGVAELGVQILDFARPAWHDRRLDAGPDGPSDTPREG